MVLDLSELKFMDSTGLRVLLRARAAAEEGRWEIVLRNVPPTIRRLFDMTGVHDGAAGRDDLSAEGYTSSPAVGVAQLVELLVVVQVVAGSSPVAHPSRKPR